MKWQRRICRHCIHNRYTISILVVMSCLLCFRVKSGYIIMKVYYNTPHNGKIYCWYACASLPPWWRHQMETYSALLAICAVNSPVTGEFLAQRTVTRSFHVFFDLRLHAWLNGWVNNREAGDLRRHRAHNYVIVMTFPINDRSSYNSLENCVIRTIWHHDMGTNSALLDLCLQWGNPLVSGGFPSRKAIDVEFWWFPWFCHQ